MNKELVSVCIPTYNGEKYLKSTLESVLNQTYTNLEIIINDDISTDRTLEIVKSYNDDRIFCFVNTEKKGLAGNWNEAVKRSNGVYIKVLCQDDLLYPDTIEKQVCALKNDKTACVIGNSRVINSSDKTVYDRKYFRRNRIVSGKRYALKSLLGRNIYMEPGNIMYRASCYEKYGVYDSELKYTPDWDFALRISVNENISCICDYVFDFRISESSETSRLYREQMNELLTDTDNMLEKIIEKRILKINVIRKFIFKFNIRVLALMRGAVLKISGKRR